MGRPDSSSPSILSHSLWSCCMGQLSHCWLWVFAFCCSAATEKACFKVSMISSTYRSKAQDVIDVISNNVYPSKNIMPVHSCWMYIYITTIIVNYVSLELSQTHVKMEKGKDAVCPRVLSFLWQWQKIVIIDGTLEAHFFKNLGIIYLVWAYPSTSLTRGQIFLIKLTVHLSLHDSV